jgi:hypothetical protein
MSEESAPGRNSSESQARQRGASLIEYALLAAFILTACVFAVNRLGNNTANSIGNPRILDAIGN